MEFSLLGRYIAPTEKKFFSNWENKSPQLDSYIEKKIFFDKRTNNNPCRDTPRCVRKYTKQKQYYSDALRCVPTKTETIKTIYNQRTHHGASLQRKRMNRTTNILLCICLVALLTACIREDRSDCHNTIIHLEYMADGEESVLQEYVEDLNLYIFDDTGHRLRNYSMTELGDGGIRLNLDEDEYTLVTVANANKHTYIVEGTGDERTDFYLQHPDWYRAGDVVETHDHNYIGEVKISVSSNGIEHRDTISLRSAHVNMEVEITGLDAPTTRADMPYTLRIEQSHARTNFYNQLSALGEETVQPRLTYDAEKGCYHTANLALFRMDQDGVVTRETCPHQVVLLDATGTELVRYNLYDYLQRFANEIDVTKQEATIPLEIQFSKLGVEIVLPGWNIEDVKPDWG